MLNIFKWFKKKSSEPKIIAQDEDFLMFTCEDIIYESKDVICISCDNYLREAEDLGYSDMWIDDNDLSEFKTFYQKSDKEDE